MTDAGWGEDCDSASGILREWRVLGHEQDSIPEASILVTGLCLAPATPHLPDPQADLPVWPIALNQASLTVRPLVGMTHFTKQPVMQVIQTADVRGQTWEPVTLSTSFETVRVSYCSPKRLPG